MTGNFIADHIRGNRFTHLDPEIQKGIFLHRQIDTFTDAHPVVRKSKRRLHARYGHYKGIIIDLFYDHFLAKNWNQYSETPLEIYVDKVYQLLEDQKEKLPKKTQDLLPYMIEYNWLYNYQFFEGMQKVLNGMNKRTHLQSQMHLALEDLKDHYTEFEKDFTLFFEDLRAFTKNKIIEINQTTINP
ncbi:ACP phosphodiesterase [Polaribacter pacificus]|uniref:ACP phosphodiesterase n=2 Tax=Polaribacter pacificus TaxID=1775173 RepID=A0A917MAH7_9FLAO|nr:ACP phosphodiesterase [Polaribacter pacificus]